MRYSIVKAATVALLGLGNILISVTAFPTGITDIQERSISSENVKLAARAKPVPKLGDYDYTADPAMVLPNKPIMYIVKRKGNSGTINQIRIDKNANSIAVTMAYNKADTQPPKLFLSDIQMSLFVYQGGKTASDLAILSYEGVDESTTKVVIKNAFEKLKKGDRDVITVTPLSIGLEKEVFDDLMKTPFGKNVQRLHDDFDTGLPKKVVLSGGSNHGTLTVYLK
ncbi:hypothetical protein BGZ60DRAFT_525225 [Tricladium varicosporioides]|nr:hypothetical protein BGZ60DRAFT_525225 [Hymenoscyphus varicosporioides]